MSQSSTSPWTISGKPPDFNKLADAALVLMREAMKGLGAKDEDLDKHLPTREVVRAALEENFAEDPDS